MSGIYTIEDLREKGLEEPLVRIPFKISCRESAEVWISAGKSFRLEQSMHSECKGSRKRSHTTLIRCLCGPTTLSGSLCLPSLCLSCALTRGISGILVGVPIMQLDA